MEPFSQALLREWENEVRQSTDLSEEEFEQKRRHVVVLLNRLEGIRRSSDEMTKTIGLRYERHETLMDQKYNELLNKKQGKRGDHSKKRKFQTESLGILQEWLFANWVRKWVSIHSTNVNRPILIQANLRRKSFVN